MQICNRKYITITENYIRNNRIITETMVYENEMIGGANFPQRESLSCSSIAAHIFGANNSNYSWKWYSDARISRQRNAQTFKQSYTKEQRVIRTYNIFKII